MQTFDPDAMAEVVVTTITRALVPMQAEVKALQERLVAWEARWSDLGALRERIAVVETKAAQAPAPPAPAVHAGPELADLTTALGQLRERTAVLETRAPIPGPPGANGEHGTHGRDGKDGRDGRDGLGFGELAVEHDGERTFTIKAIDGERVKALGTFALAYPIYRGVYVDAKTYDAADRVTWAGSEWHCNEPTRSKPGDGSKAWTLCVKRGRDGKDGQDAPSLPVVKVR